MANSQLFTHAGSAEPDFRETYRDLVLSGATVTITAESARRGAQTSVALYGRALSNIHVLLASSQEVDLSDPAITRAMTVRPIQLNALSSIPVVEIRATTLAEPLCADLKLQLDVRDRLTGATSQIIHEITEITLSAAEPAVRYELRGNGAAVRSRSESPEPGAQRIDVTGLNCAALVDAMGRIHAHRAHILPLRSPDPARPLFGPAVTIAYLPYRDDLPQNKPGFAELFLEAVAEGGTGRVLVLAGGGYPDVSYGGGVKLSRVQQHRLAGVLADARLRDFDELRRYDAAIWCRGETTRWGGDAVMPYAANVAVEVAGVLVVPGDYVYADAAGAVIIPAASLSRVLDEAAKVDGEDREALEQISDEGQRAPVDAPVTMGKYGSTPQ